MGWGNLPVINEDRAAADMGFGKHGHRNKEIIGYAEVPIFDLSQ